MLNQYRTWIQAHYPDEGAARHRCREASSQMALDFPELKQVRGWYGGKFGAEHWWCRTADGEVVDPTAAQFYRQGLPYVEFREGVDAEPVGKCMCCGDYIWHKDPKTLQPTGWTSHSTCCQDCADDLEESRREDELRRQMAEPDPCESRYCYPDFSEAPDDIPW